MLDFICKIVILNPDDDVDEWHDKHYYHLFLINHILSTNKTIVYKISADDKSSKYVFSILICEKSVINCKK